MIKRASWEEVWQLSRPEITSSSRVFFFLITAMGEEARHECVDDDRVPRKRQTGEVMAKKKKNGRSRNKILSTVGSIVRCSPPPVSPKQTNIS